MNILRPFASAMESDGMQSSGVGSGTVYDDVDHDGDDYDDREGDIDIESDTDIDIDIEDDYSYDSHNDRGNFGDRTSDLHPHHWWGTGKGFEVAALGEWGSGAEVKCEYDTDTEAELALDTSKTLESILQEYSEIL